MTPTNDRNHTGSTSPWAFHGWRKHDTYTEVYELSPRGNTEPLATIKVVHATGNAYAKVGGEWVDRQAALVTPLPWETEGLPDTCVLHVPLVRDTQTRRLARGALLAVVRELLIGVRSEELHRLALTLQAVCGCTYSLECESRRASLLTVAYKRGWHELRVREWQELGQHLFDACMARERA